MALFGLDVMTSLPEPRQGGNHGLVLCRPDRGRTCDLRIWNPLLYQLSYWPVQGDGSMSLEPETGLNCRPFPYQGNALPLSYPGPSLVVGREGFEPSKAEPTDLQSAPFDRSGISPHNHSWSWLTDSNPRPADYKSAALPTELSQPMKAAYIMQNLR